MRNVQMSRIAGDKSTKPQQNRNFSDFRKTLLTQRQQLAARINQRLGQVTVEREPDDEGAVAIDNYTKDLAAATIERERRTLNEIEIALSRLEAGEYGICNLCGISIPKIRLEALPSATLCVSCAERSAAA
jgi:DnaK suppressor protein